LADQFYDEAMALRQEQLALTRDMVLQRKELLSSLALRSGESVLDIGSGNGILAREMKQIVGSDGLVCGVDAAAPMIEMARRFCPGGEFHLGDATELPLESAWFDAVTASQLLCFVHEPDKAVREMFRVLKPGGRVVILDSDWGSLVWNCSNRALMDRTVSMLTAPYADCSVPRTLSRRLNGAGFEITDRRSFTVLNWEMDPDTYAQQTAGFIKSMMEDSDSFTNADWTEWAADQDAISAAGECLFSLNRYIFRAVKPA